MARITVEDCLKNVKNRFELVLIASKRSRMLSNNPSLATVEWGRDKPPVVALREIAVNKIGNNLLEGNAEETTDESNVQEQETSDE